jgi:hypothetical protein
MLFTQYEEELFKSVARNPSETPRLLISPEVNMAGNWFTSPLAAKAFSSIAQDALMDKPASLISILAQGSYPKEEIEYLTMLWKAGKITGEEDMSPVVNALRNDGLGREVNRVWEDYNHRLKKAPEDIRDHINDMGAELSTISHDGIGYDPRPSAHYDDDGIEVAGTWGSKSIDQLLKGVPSAGYMLFIAPSGFGKSVFSRSCVAYMVSRFMQGENRQSLIAVNEMDSGVTARGIRNAVRDMWRDERPEDEIIRDIDRSVRVYEDVYNFSKFEQMLYWHRPSFAVIDSLDALGYPSGTEKLQEAEKHQARAIRLHDISKKYGTFILVPSNASGENQRELKNGNLNKVQNAQAFQSIWYMNKSIISTVMTWDTMNPQTSLFKNVKHRPMGQEAVGEIVSMAHSKTGHYYYDPVYVNLNP